MLKINSEFGKPLPLHNLIQEHLKNIASKLSQKRAHQFKQKLSELGFIFETQEAFIDFCKNRVTRVSPDYENNPKYSEFYVDFVDKNKKGIFIGSLNDETEYSLENGKAVIKFGNLQ